MPEATMRRVMDSYREWYEEQVRDETQGSLIPIEESE